MLHAQLFLNSTLEAEKIDVSILSAVVTVFMHSSLLWKDDLSPSGLAFSVLTSLNILKPNILRKGIILDYLTKHDMSSALLEKLTKMKVLYPVDIEGLVYRIQALYELVKLFFNEQTFSEQGFKALRNLVMNHCQLL